MRGTDRQDAGAGAAKPGRGFALLTARALSRQETPPRDRGWRIGIQLT